MLCIVAIVDPTHVAASYCPQQNNQDTAIVDSTLVVLATATFKDFVTLHKRMLPTKQQMFNHGIDKPNVNCCVYNKFNDEGRIITN